MFKHLIPCIKEYKKQTILSPLLVIGEVILEVLIPILMANIIDIGIANKDMSYIIKTGALMVLMSLISLSFGAGAARCSAVAATGFAKNLRQKLFYKLQEYSFANMDKFSTASLVTRLTTDVNNTQHAFMMLIRVCIRSPFMLVFAVIMAFKMNASLACIFFAAVPVLGIALYLIATRAFPRFGEMLKKYDLLNSKVQENLIAIRVVKAFVREEYEKENFNDVARQVQRTQINAEKLIILNGPIMQMVMYSCMLAVYWFGGNLIIAGGMQTGEFMGFVSYVSQILMALMMISMVFVMLVLTKASITRINEALDEDISLKDNKSSDIKVSDGSISFKNVDFAYNEKANDMVLKDINFEIKSGETVGIIGGTGSAKSSLVNLIPRLYDVTNGEIYVGGKNVKDYSLFELREAVAMVLQKNVLFSGTIRENLKWGDTNASQEEIEKACKIANAHDFITAFPDGYDTNLGQGGVNVSGGQKQRLCIARALLKKPKIIIMDDSTSAVDTATDKSIREALKTHLKATTTIIVAQRISSVCDADKIIVMDNGMINGIGNHEELMASNEIYREVYESQQKGVDENAGTQK